MRFHPTDVHVGARLKKRRLERRMTQTDLGNALGLTFQQIQKYERGANRIGSSRLWDICIVLNVTISYFFEGLERCPCADAAAPFDQEAQAERKNLAAVIDAEVSPTMIDNFLKVAKGINDDKPPMQNSEEEWSG